MGLIDKLRLPETKNIQDLDDPSVTLLHAEIIERKPFLKKLYIDFYKQLLECIGETEGKKIVELGSGAGFIKQLAPDVITSDVLELPNVDMIFSAIEMPFETSSVDAFLMIDVLHHIPDGSLFFNEALRCLKTGGKIVMIEPANTPFSGFIYKNFHHEQFDTKAGWNLDETGPLSSGNGAIPWIIFERDRKLFESKFQGLKINRIRFHTPFAYLLSGGFPLRQLVPSFSYGLVKAFEFIISPLNKIVAMFQTIELEKIA